MKDIWADVYNLPDDDPRKVKYLLIETVGSVKKLKAIFKVMGMFGGRFKALGEIIKLTILLLLKKCRRII